MPQLRRHRLDDDFLSVEYAIDNNAEGFRPDLRHHHKSALSLLFGRSPSRSNLRR